MLELLAPAGGPEAVVAAVQSGADAVYLGYGPFNARRAAAGFSETELEQACAYCRIRGCKVYVTFNTLVSDREMTELVRAAEFACRCGADAALVQDLGVAKVFRETFPQLPLHASTQMSIHNLAGVYAAAQLGLSRVVLARELNRDQIRHIAQNSPIETEVFVHGSLCVCHSGQCYMSALMGRRSGNRGMCAQPCRLDYSMSRRVGPYPLSLKDNCLAAYLGELEEAGVTCVKIEGRMKRPEYTALATGVYARAIREKTNPTPQELRQLAEVFSRDGFTDAYYTGDFTQDMHGIAEKPDENRNRLYTEIRKKYDRREIRRTPVKFYFVVKGALSSLMAEDGDGNYAKVNGPVVLPAETAPLTERDVTERLMRTGGTPYYCTEVKTAIEPGRYLSASSLNEMRRSALQALTEKRAAPPDRQYRTVPPQPQGMAVQAPPVLNIQVSSPEHLVPDLLLARPAILYVPMHLLNDCFSLVLPFVEAGTEICAVLPRVITDSEMDETAHFLETLRGLGVRSALTGNLGHIALARRHGFEVRGDYGLNVFHSYTSETLREAGLLSVTASFELRFVQIQAMAKCVDTEILAYGRLPCMITDQDLITRSAGSVQAATASLSDRYGAVFPVYREAGGRNVIYNAHKLFLGDKRQDFANIGLWAYRLVFTTESARECMLIAKAYMGQSDYSPNGLTRGLYYRGVE